MAEIEVAVETVTTIVPREEHRILSGPNEKQLIFSLFRENGVLGDPEFTLLAGGEDHKVKCRISLVQRDDIREVEGARVCYYLTGEMFDERRFLGEWRLFVALYDPHRRKGRWFFIPRTEQYVALHLPSHAFIKGNIESPNAERCENCGATKRRHRSGDLSCPNCTAGIL